jgi:hypothetical protein
MKLLVGAKEGRISAPGAPVPPELLKRSWGNFSLGGKAYDYEDVTKQREALHAQFMEGVAENPENYSPVVHLPDVDELGQSLVGRKIEVRLKVSSDHPVWTFEGTIKKFASKD